MPTPPAGFSISIPTGPAPDYNALLANDPFYKQQLEWLTGDAAKREAQIKKDMAREQQAYALNVAQANASAGGGGDYGLASAQAQAALAKETAAHEDKLREEQIREIMASRGMASSGQLPFEQQERQYDLTQMLKGIDLDLEARASAAASARSQAQAGLQLQLQEMLMRHGWQQEDYQSELGDLPSALAKGKGTAAFDTYMRLLQSGGLEAPTTSAIWDDSAGLYKGPNGQYYDASGNPVAYSPPSSQPPAAPALPDVYTAPSTNPYGPPIPQLPKAGSPYIAV